MLPSIKLPVSRACRPGGVLLFEPDPLVCLVLTELFSDEGIDVLVCGSLAEVEAGLATCRGSLAMVDAPCRPGARSRAVDESVARIARSRRLILTSASRCDKLVADLGLDLAGAVDVLNKPFDLDELVSLVRERLIATNPAAA